MKKYFIDLSILRGSIAILDVLFEDCNALYQQCETEMIPFRNFYNFGRMTVT